MHNVLFSDASAIFKSSGYYLVINTNIGITFDTKKFIFTNELFIIFTAFYPSIIYVLF